MGLSTMTVEDAIKVLLSKYIFGSYTGTVDSLRGIQSTPMDTLNVEINLLDSPKNFIQIYKLNSTNENCLTLTKGEIYSFSASSGSVTQTSGTIKFDGKSLLLEYVPIYFSNTATKLRDNLFSRNGEIYYYFATS